VTGWLLIFALLLLGGLLATFGDLLGSRVGKARLSIFKLRPKSTAVFITAITGSFISAISLGLMLMVSRQLRVGLFELDDLQIKLQESRLALLPLKKERKRLETRIINDEKELKNLEKNLLALRRGNVVISSGQTLATAKLTITDTNEIKSNIESLLQRANLYAYLRIRPGEKPNRRILLIRRDHIESLEKVISKKGSWVVNIRSAGNILRGENYIYAFPEVIKNRKIIVRDEVVSSIRIDLNNLKTDEIDSKIRILLASTLAEVKRRGSISSEININPAEINNVVSQILNSENPFIQLNSVSMSNCDTADPVSVRLDIVEYKP
tara:strand:+ start:12912 stop:13883 length:972 start_codon:yes stop_codon:yes gene_type:complete